MPLTRRHLLAAGLVAPWLGLPGCVTRVGEIPNLEEAIRRLLMVSTQRALARLLAERGYFADELARVNLPSQLGGNRFAEAFAVLLGSRMVQDRLLRLVNDAAAEGARAAAPIVYETIRGMTIDDARLVLRGGPTAATDYLQRAIGEGLFNRMYPEVGRVLRLADDRIVARALQIATGIDFAGLQADVTRKAALGLYRAIAREESAIRADPAAAGDPMLARLLGGR